MGNVKNRQTNDLTGICLSEFIAAREEFWRPLNNQLVFIGCGDDREPTPESAAELDAVAANSGYPVMHLLDGYASIYGGVAGEAKNVLVVGAAQYGKKFITDIGGFNGAIELLVQKSHNPQTVHSAVDNEHNQRQLHRQGDKPIGCAYCSDTGATSYLLISPEVGLIREVGRQDQKYMFGSDKGFDNLLQGHKLVLKHATDNQQSSFTVNRSKYKAYLERYGNHLGVMILAGNHSGAKTSGVISNFSLDEVGSAHAAHLKGLDFYRLDIAVVTRIILETLHDTLSSYGYRLSPELLMRAFQLDATSVRAMLASHDADPAIHNNLDPRYLPIGKHGNPWSSIAAIERSQQN